MFFDRDLPLVNASRIRVEQYKSAFKAVEHMIQQGCRNIAHLAGPKGLSVSDERQKGYEDAMRRYGIPYTPRHIVHCEKFQYNALERVQELMQVKPDGIFAVNDPSGVIAIKYVHSLGLRVPQDIAVVGFNGDPVAEVVEPALTTIVQPGYEVGREALKMLIRHIEQRCTEAEELVLEGKLEIRGSSQM
jgi:DNA-binding LacI/PurR family transcriptional regulator